MKHPPNFFRDSEGNIVIYQNPNMLLILSFILVVTTVLTTGQAHRFFELLAFGAFTVWATDEARTGLSPFRKALGYSVLALLVAYAALVAFR